MADIVNLRQARKRKVRSEKEVRASQNRAAFGRPKVERTLAEAQNEDAQRRLDLHRRDREGD